MVHLLRWAYILFYVHGLSHSVVDRDVHGVVVVGDVMVHSCGT